MEEAYLGDGLYAGFDGFTITLRAPRVGGDHYVCLEPNVFKALVDFKDQCYRDARDERANP